MKKDAINTVHGLVTYDLGKIWTSPEDIVSLALHYEEIEGVKRPVVVSDFNYAGVKIQRWCWDWPYRCLYA